MRRQATIEDQALDWLVRRNGADWSVREQDELDAWLEESMAHKAAFWRAEHGWRQTDRVGALGLDADDQSPRDEPRRTWRPAAIAAGVAAALLLGAYFAVPQSIPELRFPAQAARFDTAVGGRQIVPLPDGSKVELNTRTVVRTSIDESRREVWLDTGEAFFEVTHRAGEPFVVHAGPQTITVLGTKFSVRRDKDRVMVNVLEGRVRIDNGEGSPARAAVITAGDTAITRGASTLLAVKSVERVENALAWRDGRLSFDQAPLTEVVAEFNRYNRTRLVVVDAAAGQIPIGGSFQASSVDSFVRLLGDAYGLKVEHDQDTVRISSP